MSRDDGRNLVIVLWTRRYGASYYGRGRDPRSRGGGWGYGRYTRASSNADVAAYLLWRFLPSERVLDVGCAHGFLVEALRELGVEARGVDASRWAISHASGAARPFVRRANVSKHLPFAAKSFDVVSVLETLEHIPPGLVPHALDELRRVCRGWVIATIPSFGPNAGGPPGWLEGKVRDDRVAALYELGRDFDGPVAEKDLARDIHGELVEGHVTIASYRWWTEQFETAGFVRCPDVERRVHPHLARFGLTAAWCLYVFRTPDTPTASIDVRDPEMFAAVERRWGLDGRRPSAIDLELLRLGLGDDALRQVGVGSVGVTAR
jgi:SAM-dependent methyltransferase